MHTHTQALPLMPLTLHQQTPLMERQRHQRRLLIGMRIFLGLLAVLAICDFFASLST